MAKINPLEIKTSGTTLELLARQVAKAFREVEQYFRSVSVDDNFKRELWEGTIVAGAEQKIPHRLKVIPSGYIILSDTTGLVRKGSTAWTVSDVYLENPAMSTDAICKVAILP